MMFARQSYHQMIKIGGWVVCLASVLNMVACPKRHMEYIAVIIDAETRRPINGAAVVMLDNDYWQLTTAVAANDSGEVKISNYPPQSAVVCVYLDGYYLYVRKLSESASLPDSIHMWQYTDLGPDHRYSIQPHYSLEAMEIMALDRPLDFSILEK